MLWVISLGDIFCPGATKRGRWPEHDPGKLGNSLLPTPFWFSFLRSQLGREHQPAGVRGSRGQIKEETAPSPLSCRASAEMIRPLAGS